MKERSPVTEGETVPVMIAAEVPQEQPVVIAAEVPQEQPVMIEAEVPQEQPVEMAAEVPQEQPLVAAPERKEDRNPVVPAPTRVWQMPQPCAGSDPRTNRIAMW